MAAIAAQSMIGNIRRLARRAIGLPAPARAATRVGHQLGRHPQDALAAPDQKPLERARDVPAVLQRPHAFAAELARPHEQRGESLGADPDRLLAQQFAGCRRHRGDRLRALVGVSTEHDHDLVHLHLD
jgi:hypothetical protein